MSISDGATTEVRARDKPNVILMLVTIKPPGFDTIYLVNNNVNITSRSQVYTALPLTIGLSADDGESVRQIELVLDNVSLEMITYIRTVTVPIPIIVETVFSNNLDQVEQSINDLLLKDVTYSATQIKGLLVADDDLNQLIPSDTYNSVDWKGLF